MSRVLYWLCLMGIYKCRPGLIWSLLIAVILAVLPTYWELRPQPIPLEPPATVIEVLPKTEVFEDTIQKNTTLVATFVDYQVPVTIANEIASLIKPVFDVRRLRSGNPFRLEKE